MTVSVVKEAAGAQQFHFTVFAKCDEYQQRQECVTSIAGAWVVVLRERRVLEY